MEDNNSSRFVDIKGFMEYTTLGKNRATEFGKEIGCRVRVGKRILYDLRKADQYLTD